MARLRFGDQSVPRVTRVATGGGGGSLGGLSDVDLTDTSQGGLRMDQFLFMTKQTAIRSN